MIRYVRGKVGQFPVGLYKNPVLVVSEIRGSKPCRAFLLIDKTSFFQFFYRGFNESAIAQFLLFAVPDVKLHAEVSEVVFNALKHRLARKLLKCRCPGKFPRRRKKTPRY